MGQSLKNDDLSSYDFIHQLTALDFVKKVYLFGSRAKGMHLPRADIDLAIDCSGASNEGWNRVLSIIDNADTLLEVDCVRFDTIRNLQFKEAILSDHVVLYEKDDSE